MILAALALIPIQEPTNMRFIGRFLKSEEGYSCEWPGSAVQFYTKSKAVKLQIKASSPDDRWQVDVDGVATSILKLSPRTEEYTIDLPSAASHLVTLVRRTECFTGVTTFKGLLNGVKNAPRPQSRKIEIIGDSISAGYGVDGAKKEEHYSVETSNAYMTYGWIAARQVHADPTIVAWSGRKMYPDNTIPEIFDYILPAAKRGASDQPDDPNTDAVLINLATNDFGKGIPDKFKWCGAYTEFVRKVRSKFPKAHIYLATGSMMTDTWPPNDKHLSTLKGYLDGIKSNLRDPKVHRIDFAPQDEAADGIGSDWHPNKNTQTKMGLLFAQALRHDLGW